MSNRPTQRQTAVLRDTVDHLGFIEQSGDTEAAEQCVERGWLIPEDQAGYAITLDGRECFQGRGVLPR